MKQQAFEDDGEERWREFERLLGLLDARGPIRSFRSGLSGRHPLGEAAALFPQLYREVCRDLSHAVQRCYSPRLVDRLNDLALAGHRQLYSRTTAFGAAILRFVVRGFPERVRRDIRVISVAGALFALPGLLLFACSMAYPELVYSVLPPSSINDFESMYDPANRIVGSGRSAETDVAMFGYYIANNIGIGFRTFAMGILGGVGTVYALVYNGLVFGALSSHMIAVGYQASFFGFVVSHAAIELTAIVISGGAGLKLGYALLSPGRLRRVDALRRAASESVQLVYGVIAMLTLAACIEAFWSSQTGIPIELKMLAGATFAGAASYYFARAGTVSARSNRAGSAAAGPQSALSASAASADLAAPGTRRGA